MAAIYGISDECQINPANMREKIINQSFGTGLARKISAPQHMLRLYRMAGFMLYISYSNISACSSSFPYLYYGASPANNNRLRGQ